MLAVSLWVFMCSVQCAPHRTMTVIVQSPMNWYMLLIVRLIYFVYYTFFATEVLATRKKIVHANKVPGIVIGDYELFDDSQLATKTTTKKTKIPESEKYVWSVW